MKVHYPMSAVIGSIISVIILTSFPLITQVYIKYLYKQDSVSTLLSVTLFFALLFIIKMCIDMFVETRKTKYFLKIEKDVKEKIFEKYKSDLKRLLHTKSELIASHVSLFLLYLRTKQEHMLDVVRILVVTAIIFFYDRHLFFYVLYAIPFFLLFYFLGKRIQFSKIKEKKTEDFGVVLLKASEFEENRARREVMSHLEAAFRKKMQTRSRTIPLRVSMQAFLSFFRIFYLAYFGYYAITSFLDLSGLIVGLLYLTLFIRPCIHLIETAYVYEISQTSRRKVYALYT